jgi:hypothetical protein
MLHSAIRFGQAASMQLMHDAADASVPGTEPSGTEIVVICASGTHGAASIAASGAASLDASGTDAST